MRGEWGKIEVLSCVLDKPEDGVYKSGRKYKGQVILNINGIPPENVGVEFIITRMLNSGKHEFVVGSDLKLVSSREGKSLYNLEMVPEKAGTFFYGLRLYPKHPDLPNRQDFYLLKWIV